MKKLNYYQMTSDFDEKSGIVPCSTPWGRWWQTVDDVWIEVETETGTKGKEVKVQVEPNRISCEIRGKLVFDGRLCRTVVSDESVWVIEGQRLVQIQMAKAGARGECWTSLLVGQFVPDAWTLDEMRKKLDLELFQIENPGFDFSNAKMSKTYES